MIERYTIATSQARFEEGFSVQFLTSFKNRYNATPTQSLPIITSINPKIVKYFYWGTEPRSSMNKRIASKIINAPIEQLTEKHFYKNALKSRRCIILADGFYVWNSISKKRQIPYRITLADKSPFAMAGLWETYENLEGIKVGTFSIITTVATAGISKLTNDMPIILDVEQGDSWLQPTNTIEASLEVLNSRVSPDLISYAVSPMVNNLANDSENLLNPAPPADQFGNYSLFD